MKKQVGIKSGLLSIFMLCLLVSSAQVSKPQATFDREKEKAAAILKGMPEEDLDGYLFAIEREFWDKQTFKIADPNDPYGYYGAKDAPVVITSAACVNASFENTSFINWTGSSGNSNTCGAASAPSPNYNVVTPSIVSPAGPNAGLTNTANYHTIMTIPATNPLYPTCNQFGYDSVAVLAVGSNTVSQIPHVCPYYSDGRSVRMNGALANYRAARMRYNFALTPFNRNITYAFALVLYGAHTANQQPYFKVTVLDQFNNPIGGNCGVYNVNGLQATTDTSFKKSVLLGGTQISFRPWRQYGVDLTSPIYATVTAVNLEFTVGGCCAGGHYGYAYVDAECSQGGTYSSMCAGTNSAVLTAPTGYVAYQWFLLPGMVPQPPSVGGNTPTLTVNPAIVGQVYQIQMVTPTGCTITLNDTIKISGIQILNIGSTGSCPGGTSGTATVNVTGSNTGYGFSWINSIGAVVSTTNVATGLAPGIYTVTVSGVSCGPPATATVAVASSPPTTYSYNKNYCGNLAILTASAGTSYVWYSGSTVIAGANTSSLIINNPINNAVYVSTYVSPFGCKDSVRYTLKLIPGGSVFVSNIKDICPTSPPVSYGVINLNTTQTGPYSYTVTGPSSYLSTLINTPLKKDSVIGLSIGTYSVIVNDGACFYNTTFSVTPYNYNYTVTPTNSVLCITGTVPMGVSLTNTTAPVCGGAVTSSCANPKTFGIGAGTLVNSTFGGFPCVYGAYYDVCRHQLLYTPAELTAAGIQPGQISSMQFLVNSILPIGLNTSSYIGSLQGFEIKMKCTPLTVLNNVWDNAGFTTVYNPVTYTPSVGWNNHAFNTPFNWDGTSSILVDVCFNWVGSNPFTSNPTMPYANVGVVRTRYYYSTSQALCGMPTTCFTTSNRPNVRFGNCPITKPSDFTYLWTPSYALSSLTTQSTVSTPSTSTIYSITVNPVGQINCALTKTVDIQVIIPVTPTITSGAFCTNFAATAINVTPTTGTWSPTAYMGATGVFTPSLAAIGANTVAYTTGAGTCIAASTLTINVEQYNPATLTASVSPKCITDPVLNLMSLVANTTGTWSGTGVSGTTFDPSTAGVGLITLTYNTNSLPTTSLCPDVSNIQISVHSVQQPTITPAGPYCNNGAPVQLMVSPTGGYFGGINNGAVSPGGTFNPVNAVIGANTIGYTVTSGPCSKTESITINVEQFMSATLTGSLGPYCYNNPQVPLSMIVSSAGGVWSGVGINSGTFDPALSGPGDHLITYSTNSSPTASLCPHSASIVVHVNPKPIADVASNIAVACNPAAIQFNSPTVNDGTGMWYFGDGSAQVPGLSAIHTYTAAGSYPVFFYYADNIGCKVTGQLPYQIVIHPVPVANFSVSPYGEEEVSIAEPDVQFMNMSIGAVSYNWNIANLVGSTATNPTYTFSQHGFAYVTLYATNEFGCVDTITKMISIKNDYGIWVPNAFTPNDDGLNDVFSPIASRFGFEDEMKTYEFDIFDRWGEKMFSTKDFHAAWNGSKHNKGVPAKNDVYVWKIRYKDATGKAHYLTGHVTLMK